MSNDTEQKIAKQDLQALIEESSRHKKWKNFYKIFQIFATPLFITIVSMLVTWRINVQQAENTEKITEIQIESAEIIAAANRENSAKISESNQRTERLNQIKEIFTKLLTKKVTGTEIETHRMQIISLEVYKGDSLPFLLNMKEHYQNLQDGSKNDAYNHAYKDLIEQVDISIYNILLNSQIDVSEHLFVDCGTPSCKGIEKDLRDYRTNFTKSIKSQSQAFKDIKSQMKEGKKLKSKTMENINSLIDKFKKSKKETMEISKSLMAEYKENKLNEMNMRQQEYKNYNFSDSSFLNVNLYKADFSSCTMNNNLFMRVDLQEASFFDTNLSGSIFLESNLQKVVFKESMLRNVVFVNPIMNFRDADEMVKEFCKKNSCCQLEGAQFSLGSLQHTPDPPFDIFDIDYAKNEGIGEELKEERRQLYLNLLMHHLQSISNMLEAAKKGDKKQIENRDNLKNNTGAENEEDLINRLEEAAEKAKILATPSTAHKKPLFSKR
jgi:uncharacterized protein YjbI with pentapeptide repeats